MDPLRKELIRENLPQLTECLSISAPFLAIFVSREVLAQADVQKIEAINEPFDQSKKFYELIVTRINAWDVLVHALRETKQTGVLHILNESLKPIETATVVKPSGPVRFFGTIPFIDRFVKDQRKKLLVVSSENCSVTCERISSTAQCRVYSQSDFDGLVSCHDTLNIIPPLLVVNSGNQLPTRFVYENCQKTKIVFVTSQPRENVKKVLKGKKLNKIVYETDRIRWEEISSFSQSQIKEYIETTFLLEPSDFSKILEKLKHPTLLQLLQGKTPNLFKNNLPAEISYYIPRRLHCRNIVSGAIFDANENDIYLFKNIDRDVLSEKTNGGGTQTSSRILSEIYNGTKICRFVILDDSLHFRRIYEKFPDRPVHLLRFENGMFVWEKSNGSMASIQKHLIGGQNEITEEEFAQQQLSMRRQSKYPIIIADSPGMGKTQLLRHMGRQLKKHVKTGIVAVVVINDLVKETKKLQPKIGLQRHDFFTSAPDLKTAANSVLTKTLTVDMLGQIFLEKNEDMLKELLLDGFDEITAKDEDLGYEIIRSIQSQFVNTRIWITTRPHMFTNMENQFNVMGYKMKAFEEQDQIRFLKSFWSRKITEGVCSLKMTVFAKECLNSVKKTFNNIDEDIAGIPLQCLLIGEVFEEDVTTYLSSRNEGDTRRSFMWLPEMNSMLTLYTKLLERKFDTFQKNYNRKNLDLNMVKQEHYYRAITALFPNFKTTFQREIRTSISLAQLYNVGFLEQDASSQSPRFIHRTFAEYFIALFIVESINTGCINKSVLDLLFENILETQETPFNIIEVAATGMEFKNYVICYFIDALLGRKPDLDLMSPQCLYNCCVNGLNKISLFRQANCMDRTTFRHYEIRLVNEDFSKIQEAAEACAYKNLPNIFEKILNVDMLHKKVYTSKFLQLATFRSHSSMVKMGCDNYKGEISLKDIKLGNYTLLHLAVIRGDFNIVEILLDNEQISKSLHKDQSFYNQLISKCVIYTKNNDCNTIRERKVIISHLANVSKKLFVNDRESVLSKEISVDLAVHVLKCAPHVYQNPTNVSLLTKIVYHFTKYSNSKEFLNIVEVVFSGNMRQYSQKILNQTNMQGQSLIQNILLGMDPDSELLNFLKTAGLEFKPRSILLDLAIKNKRGNDCLLCLLKNQIYRREELLTKLFYSVSCLNSLALETLLKVGKFAPNVRNSQGDTLMHHLFRVSDDITIDHYKVAKVLCQQGANIKALDRSSPIDILVNTRYSTNGRDIFDLFKNSTQLHTSKINYFQLKWLLYNQDQIDEHTFKDLFEKYMVLKGTCRERDSERNTLLHLAAVQGNFYAIEFLINAGCPLNVINRDTETPLHLLASSNQFSLEPWNLMVKTGSDVIALNKDNKTPICLLSSQNSNVTLEALIYALDILSSRDVLKAQQIILIAIWRCSLPIVIELCEHYSTAYKKPIHKIKCKFIGKKVTPLFMALLSNNVDILEYVMVTLRCSNLPFIPPSSCIHTYLQLASLEASIKFLRLVGEAFPQLLHVQNEQGEVPLSVRGLDARLVKLLVSLGANVNAVDEEGNSPLHRAIINSEPDCYLLVNELINSGADVNAVNHYNETPLKLTLQILNKDEMMECIKLLLLAKADPSGIDSSGNTLLHMLPPKIHKSNFHDLVETFLVEGFASMFEICNSKGKTPIEIARKWFKPLEPRTVEMLQNYGIFIRSQKSNRILTV